MILISKETAIVTNAVAIKASLPITMLKYDKSEGWITRTWKLEKSINKKSFWSAIFYILTLEWDFLKLSAILLSCIPTCFGSFENFPLLCVGLLIEILLGKLFIKDGTWTIQEHPKWSRCLRQERQNKWSIGEASSSENCSGLSTPVKRLILLCRGISSVFGVWFLGLDKKCLIWRRLQDWQ